MIERTDRPQRGISKMQNILKFIGKSAVYIGIISGLIIFGIWMNIVGNPHVVETSIGVLVSIGVGIFVWYKLRIMGKE
jgi:putative flippase GtrA